MDDDAVLCAAVVLKQFAERVAALVRQMLAAQERVAERESCGEAVFAHQCSDLVRIVLSAAYAAAAPEAVPRRSVDRGDLAVGAEVFPMLAE